MVARTKYKRRVWGGFHNGRLDNRMIDDGFGGWGHGGMYALAIFTSKKRAREEYEDVRPLEVRELALTKPHGGEG